MRPTLVFPPELDIPPTTADRSIVLIGRHPQCDVVLKLSSVSRRHCVLVESDDDLMIRDLGSRHGVWVNGNRVDEATLHVGDELAIGPVIVKVVDPAGISGDMQDDLDTSTEITDARPQAFAEVRPGDSGLMATDPIHPLTPLARFPCGHVASDNAADDSDDEDIPSDSKLEEVL